MATPKEGEQITIIWLFIEAIRGGQSTAHYGHARNCFF